MKKLSLLLAATVFSTSVLAQTAPTSSMLGTWKGTNNAAVMGSGLFHPSEANKERTVRFRNVELILVIDKENGRNFSGTIRATNNKNPTDVGHKEVILGAFSKDMKKGVMVGEFGHHSFYLEDTNTTKAFLSPNRIAS
jgi:hypothetical protein